MLTSSPYLAGGTPCPSPNIKKEDHERSGHPVCGKCGSGGVYLDFEFGQRVLVCILCGNRYPGDREGFYMSGKTERPIEEKKVEAAEIVRVVPTETSIPARRMCITCGEKPTISDSCPYCPSCMNKKSREGKKGKTAPVQVGRKKVKEDKPHAEKVPLSENSAVNIDFGRFPSVLKKLQCLADQEIRPLDLQMIYILKCHFENSKAFPGEV